jgi:hypothetical protein
MEGRECGLTVQILKLRLKEEEEKAFRVRGILQSDLSEVASAECVGL